METKKSLKLIKRFFKKHWLKWTILVVLGIIIYTGIIFYQYIYKPIYQPEELTPQKLEIDIKTYQKVMDSYYQEEENIDKILNKKHLDLFR